MRTLTLRQLQLQIGALSERVQKQLNKLAPAQLEQLAEALLKFESKADLHEWLKQHPPHKKQRPASGPVFTRTKAA